MNYEKQPFFKKGDLVGYAGVMWEPVYIVSHADIAGVFIFTATKEGIEDTASHKQGHTHDHSTGKSLLKHYEYRYGDRLEHVRFGPCYFVEYDGDRVAVCYDSKLFPTAKDLVEKDHVKLYSPYENVGLKPQFQRAERVMYKNQVYWYVEMDDKGKAAIVMSADFILHKDMYSWVPVHELSPYVAPAPKEWVNHPNHYGGKDNPYEAIKVIEAWGVGFNLGTVLRYLCRAGKKHEDKWLEDLKKAAWYLQREISNLESGQMDMNLKEKSVEVPIKYTFEKLGSDKIQEIHDSLRAKGLDIGKPAKLSLEGAGKLLDVPIGCLEGFIECTISYISEHGVVIKYVGSSGQERNTYVTVEMLQP